MADTLPHQREHYPTIVDALVAGVVVGADGRPLDIDDEIDAWHDGGDQSHGELHAYLGLSWDEYSRFAMEPGALDAIVAERRAAIDGPQDGPVAIRFGIDATAQRTTFAEAAPTALESGLAMSVALVPPADFPAHDAAVTRTMLEASFRRLVDVGWRMEVLIGPDAEGSATKPTR